MTDTDCVGLVFGNFETIPLLNKQLHRTLFIGSCFTLYAATVAPSVGWTNFKRNFLFMASKHENTLKARKRLKNGNTHFLTAALFLELDTLNSNIVWAPGRNHRQ